LIALASIASLYDRAIDDTGRQPEFLFFVSFLGSFGFIRTSAHMIRAGVSWWPGNVNVGGTHIHHLVWGMILVLVTGYVGVAIAPGSPWREIIAVLFGFGTGLALDEFALWLDLKDVYWTEQGRRSIDAVIVTAALSGIVLVGYSAWVDVANDVADVLVALTGAVGILTLTLVVVNLAKEKFGVAILGLVLPPVALVGALRLGRPRSPWARLYREQKMARAEARFGSERAAKPTEAEEPALGEY
jgi:lysyl-tRNA synthetase class 2